MAIDPKGTQPGVTKSPAPEARVHMKCKNQRCDSISATVMMIPGSNSLRIYRCTKCGASHEVNVGGAVSF